MNARIDETSCGANPIHGRLLIGGEWVKSADGGVIDVTDPTTETVFATAAAGGAVDVDRAVAAARAALDEPSWRDAKPASRAKLLLRLADLLERDADELARLESRNMGMPLWMSRGADVPTAVEELRYNAGWCARSNGETVPLSAPGEFLAYTVREPIGVVGAIVPWNFPLLLAMVKVAPALAAGCTVVLKPAEETPLTALRLGALALEAGFPPGVLNVVTGLGHTAGAALAAHPGVDKVTFTGSTEVGRAIVGAARGNLKKLSLELGGKSPTLILPDADLAKAAEGAAASIFMNSGQICAAGSRLYVHESAFDRVVERILAIARGHRLGAWDDPATTLGPLVSARHLARVAGYVDGAGAEGLEVLTGGARPAMRGWFYSPTVLRASRHDGRACREEIFGPVLVVQPVADVEQMIALANDTEYGLAAAIWTGDVALGHRLARRLRAGSVWINTPGTGDPCFTCGGYKQSGWGRERGREGFEAYLQTKSIACALP